MAARMFRLHLSVETGKRQSKTKGMLQSRGEKHLIREYEKHLFIALTYDTMMVVVSHSSLSL